MGVGGVYCERNAIINTGLVAQRITRLTTDQKIPGSNPGKLVLLLGRFADLFAVSSIHAHSVIKK